MNSVNFAVLIWTIAGMLGIILGMFKGDFVIISGGILAFIFAEVMNISEAITKQKGGKRK